MSDNGDLPSKPTISSAKPLQSEIQKIAIYKIAFSQDDFSLNKLCKNLTAFIIMFNIVYHLENINATMIFYVKICFTTKLNKTIEKN